MSDDNIDKNAGVMGVAGSQGDGVNTEAKQGVNTDPKQGGNAEAKQGENTDPAQGTNTDPKQGENTEPEKGVGEFDHYEGYLADLGKTFPDEDGESMEAFRKMAFDHKIPGEAFASFYKDASSFMAQAMDKQVHEATESLKDVYKNDFSAMCERVRSYTAKVCADAGVDVSVLSHPAITSNPDVVKIFDYLAKQQQQNTQVPSTQGSNGTLSAQAEINKILTDTQSEDSKAYFDSNHPRHKEVSDRMTRYYSELK